MLGYAADLRAETQGRATFTLEFDRYEPVGGDPDTGGDRDPHVRVPLAPRPRPRAFAVEQPEPDPDSTKA
jgi:translation elongation factor EF-G